jgi:radical SAM superfamily enzyme YgiQ (UPF0313 family)
MEVEERKMKRNEPLCVKLIHCGNISLVNPDNREQKNIFYMPMGALALAGALRDQGVEVEIIHSDLEEGNTIEELLDLDRLDAVGFDCHWINQAQSVLETAAFIKEIKPEVFVFLGGFSASLFAEEIVRDYDFIDAVIRGDGEIPIRQLCDALARGREPEEVQNLCWRESNGNVRLNPFTYLGSAEEMDVLDFTAFDCLRNWDLYLMFSRFWTRFAPIDDSPLFLLEVGRGCSYACTFCGGNCEAQSRMNNRKHMTLRSHDAIVDTVAQAMEAGYETFYTSLEFDGSDEWYIQLFETFRDEGLDIFYVYGSWRLPSAPLLETMSECFQHSIIEISPETAGHELRKLNKDARLYYSNQELEQCLRRAQQLGNIKIQLYFGYYLAGDTPDTIRQTLEYILYLTGEFPGLLEIEYSNFSTDPGSLFFFHPEKYGIDMEVRDFKSYVNRIREHYIQQKGQQCDITAFRPAGIPEALDPDIRRRIQLYIFLFNCFRRSVSQLVSRRQGEVILNVLETMECGLSPDNRFDSRAVGEVLLRGCEARGLKDPDLVDLIHEECRSAANAAGNSLTTPQIWIFS